MAGSTWVKLQVNLLIARLPDQGDLSCGHAHGASCFPAALAWYESADQVMDRMAGLRGRLLRQLGSSQGRTYRDPSPSTCAGESKQAVATSHLT
jgi:hypothetical protein